MVYSIHLLVLGKDLFQCEYTFTWIAVVKSAETESLSYCIHQESQQSTLSHTQS